MHRSFWLLAAVVAVAGVCLAVPAVVGAATFSNTNPITISDGSDTCLSAQRATTPGKASPYPSQITTSGQLGTATDVNVTLTGLSHTFPDDVDVILRGPAAQVVLLMADDGNTFDVSNVNLTFDDAAATSLPDDLGIASGTYKPTLGTTAPGVEGCAVPTSFPSPAPGGPYGSALSVFNGINPNGTWTLYVIDDSAGDTGSISGGWSLDITPALAVTLASFTAKRSHKGVVVRWRTGTEADTLGFNVFRQQGNRRVRVNRRLLPALGGIGGSSYSYRDRHAPRHRAVRYWLQDVAVNGTRTWHGPVRVAAS